MDNSHLTDAELQALQSSGLSKKSPFLIRNVSKSQFSVSRHYGGCHYYGVRYTYIPTTDELIRDDVVKWLAAERRKELRKKKEMAKQMQGSLI